MRSSTGVGWCEDPDVSKNLFDFRGGDELGTDVFGYPGWKEIAGNWVVVIGGDVSADGDTTVGTPGKNDEGGHVRPVVNGDLARPFEETLGSFG